MGIVGIDGLIEDICVSFGLPILFLCLALANIKFSSRRKFNGLKMRLSLTFAITLFAYLICTLMFQDRAVLEAISHRNPVFYLLVYSVAGVLIFVSIGALAYWKLRPELWRRNHHED
jgi:NADH:ubiquinone oxidoreductase subunit 2 (subunit N)